MATMTDHGETIAQLMADTRSGLVTWQVGPNGTVVTDYRGTTITVTRPTRAGDPEWIITGVRWGEPSWAYRADDHAMMWWLTVIPAAMRELLSLI